MDVGHAAVPVAFGSSVVLAVGAMGDAGGIGGIDMDDMPMVASYSAGAVFLFERDGSNWNHTHYIKAPNADAGDWFGRGLAWSALNSQVLVGAVRESSSAGGVGGDGADNTVTRSGAVYRFR